MQTSGLWYRRPAMVEGAKPWTPRSGVEVVRRAPCTDPRWTLDHDVMPESALHSEVIKLLEAVLEANVTRGGRDARVARNLAVRWDPSAANLGVDPDVVLMDPTPPEEGDSLVDLCLWKPGHYPPRVAVEVVSANDPDKDYSDNPSRYAASGTQELWVFDPLYAGPRIDGGPWLLQVWTLDDEERFRRVYEGDGPAWSEQLDAWIVVTDEGRRLRVADDRDGLRRWLTALEAGSVATERALAETDRLRSEIAGLRSQIEALTRDR